jgi:hypothetical protein
MRFYLFLFCCCISTSLFSQQKLAKEFSFVTDNDLYASKEKDQYYSNGIFLTYRYLASDFKKFTKKIYEIEVGHEMYSPFRSTVVSPDLHDRPFAAHLYGSFGVIRTYESEKIFKTRVLVGTIGENALGMELQEFIHDIYNFRSPVGWRYQIQNVFALNVDAWYIDALGMSDSEHADINFVAKARIGTVFNEVSAGFKGRIGFKKLQPLDNSIAFNTNLNNDKTSYGRGIESFIYYESTLTAVAYDATIQGSLFNDNSPITFTPNRVRLDFEIGYRFTAKRWNFGYAFHYHSNKLPNLRRNGGHYYGRLFFGYAFH